MKLVRYGRTGMERPGLVDAAGDVRSLAGHVADIAGAALLPRSLRRLAAIDVASLPVVDPPVRLGPCVGSVGKLVCVGLNYADHGAEVGMQVPAEPVLFMKATSAISGPNDPVVIPDGGTKLDWEVELGVVIGTPAKNIAVKDARRHVAGYCVVNDVSERSFQLEGTGQWVKGKSADTFGPTGPWLVTADEVGDPGSLDIWLEVDGVRRQDGNTGMMIFGVDELVAFVSRFMSLQPGDIIATGTPPGVGMGYEPPIWLQAGNTMRLGIEGLGVQEQTVVVP